MSDKTPTEILAAARREVKAAKNHEFIATLGLSKEEWRRDYDLRKDRTLGGRKDVKVDFTIDADDLESLGYHHEDDCTGASYDDTDVPDHETNRRHLADWHDHAHGLTLWTHCVYEPCKLLTDEFRRNV